MSNLLFFLQTASKKLWKNSYICSNNAMFLYTKNICDYLSFSQCSVGLNFTKKESSMHFQTLLSTSASSSFNLWNSASVYCITILHYKKDCNSLNSMQWFCLHCNWDSEDAESSVTWFFERMNILPSGITNYWE